MIFCLVLVAFLLAGNQPVYGQGPGQIPLPGKNIPKYVDPLPTFVGARIPGTSALTIDMLEIQHKILPAALYTPLPAPWNAGSYVWAYQVGSAPAYYPGFTIEATRGTALNVTYVNSLGTDVIRPVLQQFIKVDQTLHWADPLKAGHVMTPYAGPVPAVVHLHGAEVPSESDGGPDAWFTPGYTYKGPSWDPMMGGVDQYYYYPNTQEATTMFYHDHTLGATRTNLYAGLAGFYFLRDDRDNGLVNNPIGLPAGNYEVELAIQDRMFDTNGQLLFPSVGINPMIHPFWLPEFFGDVAVVNGKSWPFMNVEPRRYRFRIVNGSNARFYNMRLEGVQTGNAPVIWQIGTDGGFLDAPVGIASPNRLLLGPGERADVIVDFAGFAGKTFIVTNDAKAPFPNGAAANPQTVGQIMQFRVGTTITGGTDNSTPVNALVLRPTPLVKLANFVTGAVAPGVTVSKYRKLTLNEVMGMGGPTEVLVNNTKWMGTMSPTAALFDPEMGITERPVEGTTEVWQIINLTADAHPIHLHLTQFQLVSRQAFQTKKYVTAYDKLFPGGVSPVDGLTYPPGVYIPGYGPPKAYDFYAGWLGGNPDFVPYLQGKARPAELNERGWKDTFIMYPGEITTVIVRFAPTDMPVNTPAADLKYTFDPSQGPGYVWHCHIVDHEDNEMMRPYAVTPNPSRGLPKSGTVAEKPVEFNLDQNYPNPFNPSTEIRFSLPEDSQVQLRIFNSLGQEVQTLINAQAPAGTHTVKLDASNLSSGVYYYRIQAGSYNAVKKMTLLK